MRAITRQIAIGGLILLGVCSIVAAVFAEGKEIFAAIASNTVLGIVGVLKQNEDGGE